MLSLSSSAVINVGLSNSINPLGLSFARIVTVADASSPSLAPPVASDRLIVNIWGLGKRLTITYHQYSGLWWS